MGGYVPSRLKKAQSVERRWRRFLGNQRIRVEALYVPLVLAALSGWQQHRIYLALDTTVPWERYCMIHLSGFDAVPPIVACKEHGSATVAFQRPRCYGKHVAASSPGCHAAGRSGLCQS